NAVIVGGRRRGLEAATPRHALDPFDEFLGPLALGDLDAQLPGHFRLQRIVQIGEQRSQGELHLFHGPASRKGAFTITRGAARPISFKKMEKSLRRWRQKERTAFTADSTDKRNAATSIFLISVFSLLSVVSFFSN